MGTVIVEGVEDGLNRDCAPVLGATLLCIRVMQGLLHCSNLKKYSGLWCILLALNIVCGILYGVRVDEPREMGDTGVVSLACSLTAKVVGYLPGHPKLQSLIRILVTFHCVLY